MDRAGSKTVTDAEGVCGRVVPASPEVRSTAAHMVVQLDKGPQVLVPTHLLIPQPDGSYALPCRLAALEHARSEHEAHQPEPLVVPVLVEELEVQKRVVETGKVRLTKVVHERETLVDEPLVARERHHHARPTGAGGGGARACAGGGGHDDAPGRGRGAGRGEALDAAGGNPHPHGAPRDAPAPTDHAPQ